MLPSEEVQEERPEDNGEPDEVEEIRLETKKTLEMVQFVEQGEIAPLYYDAPYYVVPADELAQDAYRVVRDALRDTHHKTHKHLI